MVERRVSNKNSLQTHAYTPGLKIKRNVIVKKLRKLPIKGTVLVKIGDNVSYDTIIAEGLVPGDPVIINAPFDLDVEPERVKTLIKKNVGDNVKKEEILAESSFLFGLFKNICKSPIDGKIELVSDLSGQIIVRGAPVKVNINGYIPGVITKVIKNEGAVIETNAALIQGVLGIGGEKHGKIKLIVDSPKGILKADAITKDIKGCILVGGSNVIFDAIEKADKFGAVGIVTGGIEPINLEKYLGEEIGVAITGQENVNLTLIITEGFGQMAMSNSAFELLKKFDGHIASINGTTQIRAGVLRPEIIIHNEEDLKQVSSDDRLSEGMILGTIVRIIRDPYFGEIGKVHSLPIELQKLESESEVRVIKVKLEDDRIVIIPRANVEIIEE